jgi:hypothetical protein
VPKQPPELQSAVHRNISSARESSKAGWYNIVEKILL